MSDLDSVIEAYFEKNAKNRFSNLISGIGRSAKKNPKLTGLLAAAPIAGSVPPAAAIGVGQYLSRPKDSTPSITKDPLGSISDTVARWNKSKLPVIDPLSKWVQKNVHEGAGRWMGQNQLATGAIGAGGLGLIAALLYSLFGNRGGYKYSSASINKVAVWLSHKDS